MHLLRRDEFPSVSCNAGPSAVDLPRPTPPPGGWSAWHLTDEDDMGEGTEQGIIIRLLLAVITELARERGWTRTMVGSDQFFAWVEDEPLVRISPDIYLLDDPPHPCPESWRPGHSPPRFALEVVSQDPRKDYRDAPQKYDQLGARELVVFDPAAVTRTRGSRTPLHAYRRADDGSWRLEYSGAGPLRSVELDAWLVVVPGPHLRVARDPDGRDLVPTPSERAEALETTLEATRATLEAKIAALEAQLARQH